MASSPRPGSPRSPDCHSCCSSDGACSSSIAGFQASDPGKSDDCPSDEEYFKPLKRLCMIHLHPEQDTECNKNNNNNNNNKQLTPFSVRDILECKAAAKRTVSDGGHGGRIVRPWDLDDSERRRPRSVGDDSRSERSDSDGPESPPSQHATASTSPLDALFEMTSKAFEGIEGNENSSDSSRDHLHIFSTRQQPKKKRKSRTAFTNHQIFELEKRFLYQKYLSPADRDEIAQSLGLTNAQVITWFQNRRAKLKRDMEELKKDVDATKINHVHRNLMDNIQDLSILKTELDKKSSISVK